MTATIADQPLDGPRGKISSSPFINPPLNSLDTARAAASRLCLLELRIRNHFRLPLQGGIFDPEFSIGPIPHIADLAGGAAENVGHLLLSDGSMPDPTARRAFDYLLFMYGPSSMRSQSASASSANCWPSGECLGDTLRCRTKDHLKVLV
jgi:hypothetical protein